MTPLLLRLVSRCVLASFLLGAVPGWAQAPAEGGSAELEAVRGPYTRNMATLHTAEEAALLPVTTSYVTALERLEKELTAKGDSAASAVSGERSRTASKLELTPDMRKVMPPVLAALRMRYEADRQRATAPILQQEQQQTRQYLSALDALQRRLLGQKEVQKAAMVSAERLAVGGAPVRGTEKQEKPVAESTVHRDGKLDGALADLVEKAVKGHTYEKTENSEGSPTKEGGSDIPEEGALLVGFEYMEVGKNVKTIRSIRPYFMTRDAIVAGKDRGKMLNVTDKILARSGYAIGGILIDGKSGMQVIFMKLDPATGRFDTSSPSNVYKSKWFGTKSREKPVQLGGDGRLVVGVYGKTGADSDTLGLVQLQ